MRLLDGFPWIRRAALALAVLSPLMSQLALHAGFGVRLAFGLAGLQAAVLGFVLWGLLPGRWRWAAVAVGGAMLAGLVYGAQRALATGLTVTAGLSHGLLYGGLLLLFGLTLRPGRVPLVTRIAARVNARLTPGMIRYTRSVTRAWCLFFAGQIGMSVVLAWLAPGAWTWFVTGLHAPLNLVMAAAEYALRCWRFRGEPHSRIADMVRAFRGAGR